MSINYFRDEHGGCPHKNFEDTDGVRKKFHSHMDHNNHLGSKVHDALTATIVWDKDYKVHE